ncbi:MAG: hypothetical protein ACT4QF_20770 [Sporichthyaceae bacterium]
MRTPSTSPRRFAHRAAALGLTLLVATGTALGTAASAGATEDTGSPLGVLAPVTHAFSDTEPTALDQVLNVVVPEQASAVIATALNAADTVARGAAMGPDESDSTSTGPEDEATAITTAPVQDPPAKAKRHGKGHPSR